MSVFLAPALLLLSLQVVLWLASLPLRDVSLVDVFWGLGFVLVAWLVLLAGGGPGAHGWLLTALTSAWGLRLSVHLGRRWWRHRGEGASREDRRYREMREHHGARFWWVSLFTVFLGQAALLFVVSLPLQLTGAAVPRELGALALAGGALFALGLTFEAVGDAQLSRFTSDPANHDRVMDQGLWRYTRHPNYFGDFCVWWGLGLVALEAAGFWALVGPAVMSVLLLRVSGVALMERSIGSRRPGYAAYAKSTSAFFPWFPSAA